MAIVYKMLQQSQVEERKIIFTLMPYLNGLRISHKESINDFSPSQPLGPRGALRDSGPSACEDLRRRLNN